MRAIWIVPVIASILILGVVIPSLFFDEIFADTRDTTATVSPGPDFSSFEIDDPDGIFTILTEGADGSIFFDINDCSLGPASFGVLDIQNEIFPAIFTISDCADPLEEGVFELTLAGEFTCLSGNCLPLPDADGDGVTVAQGDCDDANDTVFPGAQELADGLDNDCDGVVDEITTFTAVQTGDWDVPATWEGGVAPPLIIGVLDEVIIPSAIQVFIPNGVIVVNQGTIKASTLKIFGELVNDALITNSRIQIGAGGTLTNNDVISGLEISNFGGTLENNDTIQVVTLRNDSTGSPSLALLNNNVGATIIVNAKTFGLINFGGIINNHGTLHVFGTPGSSNLQLSTLNNLSTGQIIFDSGLINILSTINNDGSLTVNEFFANFCRSTFINSNTYIGVPVNEIPCTASPSLPSDGSTVNEAKPDLVWQDPFDLRPVTVTPGLVNVVEPNIPIELVSLSLVSAEPLTALSNGDYEWNVTVEIAPEYNPPYPFTSSPRESVTFSFIVFVDVDGDGFSPPVDCDDADAAINPGVAEADNGVDDNCDGVIDEGFDGDGDGFTPIGGGDCDDSDAAINPDATEVFDAVDNNCDGLVDEGFVDTDSDGVHDGVDNCIMIPNPGQEDSDGDGIGDACDISTPTQLIQDLTDTVISLNLGKGTENSLTSNLDSAIEKLGDGDPSNDTAACGKLNSFLNKVAAQGGKNLTSQQAAELTADAQAITALIGCP